MTSVASFMISKRSIWQGDGLEALEADEDALGGGIITAPGNYTRAETIKL